jgi:hypothetical protein
MCWPKAVLPKPINIPSPSPWNRLEGECYLSTDSRISRSRMHRWRQIPFPIPYFAAFFDIFGGWFWIPFLTNIALVLRFAFLFLRWIHASRSHQPVPKDAQRSRSSDIWAIPDNVGPRRTCPQD